MFENLNLKALIKLIILWLFILLFYLFGPISDKPFSELSSFNQYKPCEKDMSGWSDLDYAISDFSKTYNLIDILSVEFQVSWIIFGLEQDYYLENGLDCSFARRLNFKEALDTGSWAVWRHILRRIASLGSYICVFFILRFSFLQLKRIRRFSE